MEARGCSPKKIQKKLEGHILGMVENDPQTQDAKLDAWISRIGSRIQKGRDQNFKAAQYYYAIDRAWDTPLQQVTPTLLKGLTDPGVDNEKATKILKDWGYNESSIWGPGPLDPKTGFPTKVLNLGEFIRVVVPLVKAYVTMRWAKLTNDRRTTPYLPYDPAINNPENRVKAEVITNRADVMSFQLGYFTALKQAVLKMLLYSFCLEFPMEEWYRERQLVSDDSNLPDDKKEFAKPEKKKKGKKNNDGYKTIIVKEGIRYTHPHPSRTYSDRSHPISSFNTDSGASYAGYWKVMKFGELKTNPGFYNLDKVSYGNSDSWLNWETTQFAFFNTVYSCVMKWPSINQENNDREAKEAFNYYGASDDDKSVVVTEHWEKAIPSQIGLGNYDYPVWFRVVMAADSTPIYIAPVPYNPITMYGYDIDEYRDMNSSLALEIVPWQDQFSNQLTQIFLTTKQNLVNATFVDTDQVGEEDIKRIENLGEKWWRTMNTIRFSARKAARGGQTVNSAFYSHKFPNQDTTSQLNTLRVILDTMERTLAMSSQELAQAASHEQTREEVRNIKDSTSTRLAFTAYPIDDALSAKKLQIYHGLMAYGEDEFYTQIASDIPVTRKRLEDMGFTFMEDKEGEEDAPGRKITVKVNKTAVALTTFSSIKDPSDRLNNVEVATAMSNMLRVLISNPVMIQALGADQAVELTNLIIRISGMPRDFKIRNVTPKKEDQTEGPPGVPQPQPAVPDPQEQAKVAHQQFMDIAKQIIAKVEADVAKGMQPILEHTKQNSIDIAEIKDFIQNQLPKIIAGAPSITDHQYVDPNLSVPPGAGPQGPPGVVLPPPGPSPQEYY